MEKKLSNEEIAKVFAMYYGQKIIVISLLVLGMFKIENHALLLTPLSAISDEDAVEVTEIITGCVFMVAQFEVTEHGNDFIKVTCYNKQGEEYGGDVRVYHNGSITWDYHNIDKYDGNSIRLLEAYDCLRSKGYALPYKGQSLFKLGLAIEPL